MRLLSVRRLDERERLPGGREAAVHRLRRQLCHGKCATRQELLPVLLRLLLLLLLLLLLRLRLRLRRLLLLLCLLLPLRLLRLEEQLLLRL